VGRYNPGSGSFPVKYNIADWVDFHVPFWILFNGIVTSILENVAYFFFFLVLSTAFAIYNSLKMLAAEKPKFHHLRFILEYK
jgi:hypothetical protein